MYSVYCMYTVLCSVVSIMYSVYNVLYSVVSIMYSVYNVLCVYCIV